MDSFETLLEKIQSGDQSNSFEAIAAEIQRIYGLKNIAYLGFNLVTRTTDPCIKVTYPKSWTDRYRAMDYHQIDPALRYGMRSILPVDWSSFLGTEKSIDRFFGEATEHGIGNKGISIPVRGYSGDIGLISLSTDMNDDDWINFKKSYMKDFQVLAVNLHQKALFELGEIRPNIILSEREKECLYWAACGKTAAEVGIILKLTERGVRFHVKNAVQKLNCINITHAVAKAVALELINVPS